HRRGVRAQAGRPGFAAGRRRRRARDRGGRRRERRCGCRFRLRDQRERRAAAAEPQLDPAEVERARARYRELYAKFKEETDAEREKVVALGGLYIIGTERHESRRIDNQLRGRAGRQGDPGASRFYVSLEDDLMRL